MKQRNFAGTSVGAIGLGCMPMSHAYGPSDKAESLRVLQTALDLGVNFWDTADAYGPFKNEELLSEILKEHRNEVFLATKFGFVSDRSLTSHQDLAADESVTRIVDGTPAYARKALEASLRRLGVDSIDLYYLHRVDPRTPIEETVGELGRLVAEGKIRNIGLSEASAGTVRRAHAVHPIAALQSEYSLWERDLEQEIFPTLAELEITLVPFSPLGRGFLTGQLKSPDDFAEDDFRRNVPRFQGSNFEANLEIVRTVQRIATEIDATAAQVALAWVLAKSPTLIPIPGTKHVAYLQDNSQAAELSLSAAHMATLNEVRAQGDRYTPSMMELVDRS